MEEDASLVNRPLALILVAQREGQIEETLFMYPFTYCDPPPVPAKTDPAPSQSTAPRALCPPTLGSSMGPQLGASFASFSTFKGFSTTNSMAMGPSGAGAPMGFAARAVFNAQSFVKKDAVKLDRPTIHYPRQMEHTQTTSMHTTFGISTSMLASILCVKKACLDHVLELKIDNVRLAGYPKAAQVWEREESEEERTRRSKITMFGINFILPPNTEQHVVCSFQRLAKKLAIAINEMQRLNGYLEKEVGEITQLIFEMEGEADAYKESFASRKPYERIREKSILCQTLARVFDDVLDTGIVQVFIDKMIDVSFCVESHALRFASLPPRSRADLDRLVSHLRPYHGLILLKDVWPNPDPNPSVALLLKHCTPEKSIIDISAATGIPILQVLLIVRHLLLWARVIIIYPLASNNVYTSSTFTKVPLVDPSIMSTEWSEDQIAAALAFFNPYSTLTEFIDPHEVLVEQQVRGRLMTHLLRHQLVMQLHRYYYLIEPSTLNGIRETEEPCPEHLKRLVASHPHLLGPMQGYVCQIAAVQLEDEDLKVVERRLRFFLAIVPYLNGQHHIEDMMYRMNERRNDIQEVVDNFSVIIADFLRPDEISALSIY